MKPRLRWSDYFAPGFVSVDQAMAIRIAAYQTGLAEGELRGRMLLARELEQMFPDYKDGISQEDAARIRIRQVH